MDKEKSGDMMREMYGNVEEEDELHRQIRYARMEQTIAKLQRT